ncbi:kinase-like domain-containing protein [Trichophaea hybrida]|nr:kinase-like domain-containing protein [Trichophaea hybrida]
MNTADFTDPLTIQSQLSCNFIPLSTITPLLGGFSNFTFRAHLSQSSPLVENAATVIIKHSEPYSALHRDISLDPLRCYYEHETLTSCPPAVTFAGLIIKTPTAYYYDNGHSIIVIADAGKESLDLKTLLSHSSFSLKTNLIGHGLGRFLRSLHTWGGTPELRKELAGTKAGPFWTWLNYGRLLETINKFPSVLSPYKETFVEVVSAPDMDESEKTLIHGDFWSANILVSPEQDVITVVDWEMARLAHVWQDVGQMCADLFLPYQFYKKMEGVQVMDGLLTGYGEVSGEVARRIVVHFGVSLVVWPCRVGTWGGEEDVKRCAQVGAEFIDRAWKRDWKWIKGSVLREVVKEEWIND